MTRFLRKSLEQVAPFQLSVTDRSGAIRLDFNEYSGEALPVSLEAGDAASLCSYPQYSRLIRRLADLFGCDLHREQLLLTAGSDAAFMLIAAAFLDAADRVLIARPTFPVITHTLNLWRARIIAVPLRRDFNFDIEEMHIALNQGVKLAIIPTPDNPTGATLSPDVIHQWIADFKDTLFVVDEAYFEYSGMTVLPLIEKSENLLVMRTFSKAWGLAGLRVGVTAGHADLIAALQRVHLPFPICSLAADFIAEVCAYKEFIEENALDTMRRKRELLLQLRQRQISLVEGGANFFLLQAEDKAAQLCEHLRQRRILVRNLSMPPTSPQDLLYGCLRISVGTESENQELLKALDCFPGWH